MISYLATPETLFFLVYGGDPNLPLHQLLEPIQQFLGYPQSGGLDLKSHSLALVIAKKTLDENIFKHAQKTRDNTPPNVKVGDRVYFKNKQPGKLDLKWRVGYRTVCIEHSRYHFYIDKQGTGKTRPCQCQGHCLGTTSWAMECWHQVWQSWKIYKSFNKSPHYLPKCRLR